MKRLGTLDPYVPKKQEGRASVETELRPTGGMPGGKLATRPLHLIWMLDCSGSMSSGGKIQSLNQTIREAIPHMKDAARGQPNAELLVRVIKFSNGAQWHLSQPTPIERFTWTDLAAGGVTDLGAALRMVADQLKIPPMEERALPPVLALISDGQPTDDFMSGLQALESLPWGKKAVRIAIAIGQDADRDVLSRFMGNSELEPLQADSPERLAMAIRWVSTAVVPAVSAPASQTSVPKGMAVRVPQPPPEGDTTEPVW